jgi:hypothetical protein
LSQIYTVLWCFAVCSRQKEILMDEPERDYLRQQIQSLEKANRRWKALVFFVLAAFGLFLILGMGTAFTHSLSVVRMERMAAEEARYEALRAREEAEAQAQRARQAEMQAKQGEEKAANK